MSAKTDKLTRNQARAIEALLTHRTIEDAAGAVGVNPRTIYRWMNEPAFRLSLDQATTGAINQSVADIHSSRSALGEPIFRVRDDIDVSPGVRLRAAQIIDNSLLRWRELLDVEQRITRLEQELLNQ